MTGVGCKNKAFPTGIKLKKKPSHAILLSPSCDKKGNLGAGREVSVVFSQGKRRCTFIFSFIYRTASYLSTYLYPDSLGASQTTVSLSIPQRTAITTPPTPPEVQLLYLHVSVRQHSPSSCGGQWK